jgi:hypothetical protein
MGNMPGFSFVGTPSIMTNNISPAAARSFGCEIRNAVSEIRALAILMTGSVDRADELIRTGLANVRPRDATVPFRDQLLAEILRAISFEIANGRGFEDVQTAVWHNFSRSDVAKRFWSLATVERVILVLFLIERQSPEQICSVTGLTASDLLVQMLSVHRHQ